MATIPLHSRVRITSVPNAFGFIVEVLADNHYLIEVDEQYEIDGDRVFEVHGSYLEKIE